MSDDNFSSIPAGSQRGFNSSARILRLAWLFCMNGFIALFTLWRLRGAALVAFTGQPEFQPWLIFQTTFEFVFEVCLPIAGVVFEVARRKFAQRINVGTFVVAGGFWLVAAVLDHADPFFGVLIILGVGFFVVAGLTKLVYRITKRD